MENPRPPRPKYSYQIERRYGPMLDTLINLMGRAPASIDYLPTMLNARGQTQGATIRLRDPDDTDGLMHELGHFWSVQSPTEAQRVADSLHVDPFTHAGAERLADSFAKKLSQQLDSARALSAALTTGSK